MELKIRNGDYVPDGSGGFVVVSGEEELLQRVLLKLTARRGAVVFRENFGSRLWELGRVQLSARRAAAMQYAAEALADEKLKVNDVELEDGGDGILRLRVWLQTEDGEYPLRLTVR